MSEKRKGRPISRREALGRAARVGAGAYALGTIPLLARCAPAIGREGGSPSARGSNA